MAARAAVRDAGRALDYPYDFCGRIAEEIPMMTKLNDALKKSGELKKMYDEDANVRHVIDMAKKLEGVARHASTHACGVVITKDPLVDYAPLQRSIQSGKINEDAVVTQYEGKSIEALGLLKMDFLGLKNLTVLQNVIDIIRAKYQKEISLDKIPLDDKKTLALFAKGETTGVFQFESSGFKRYLRELEPSRFQDLIDMVALYRPGPMDWIPEYIAGKHGRREITYLHPKLKSILGKTYGIVVVQEQVMEIAKQLAGFTAGEADYLRKAMGKKIKKLMDEQRDKFILGCINHGIKGKTAEKIWDFIKPFAGYGFNWAHSACYAMIGYQTAYFKAYYPSEFMAALLGSDQDNTDRIAVEVEECRKMGIKVSPPDVNESYGRFASVEKDGKKTILYGLNAVKNVGKKVAAGIVEERKNGGKYHNVLEFVERVSAKDLNKKSLESLAKSGALDAIGEREIILGNLDNILKYAKEARSVKERGQESLFGDGFASSENSQKNSALPPQFTERVTLSKRERLGFEKELLGAYLTENPLEEFSAYLKNTTTPINQLKVSPASNPPAEKSSFNFRNRDQGVTVNVGGLIAKVKKIYTKNNQEMAFVELEDLTGKLEVVVFPGIFQKNSEIWKEDKVVVVSGKLSNKDGALKVLADKAEEVTLEMEQEAKQLPITKNSEERQEVVEPSRRLLIQYDAQKSDAQEIKELLLGLRGGQDKIIFEVSDHASGKKNKIKIAGSYRFSGEGFEALKNYLSQKELAFQFID
jgi:DNA polymerase-3 subunit alpha